MDEIVALYGLSMILLWSLSENETQLKEPRQELDQGGLYLQFG